MREREREGEGGERKREREREGGWERERKYIMNGTILHTNQHQCPTHTLATAISKSS